MTSEQGLHPVTATHRHESNWKHQESYRWKYIRQITLNVPGDSQRGTCRTNKSTKRKTNAHKLVSKQNQPTTERVTNTSGKVKSWRDTNQSRSKIPTKAKPFEGKKQQTYGKNHVEVLCEKAYKLQLPKGSVSKAQVHFKRLWETAWRRMATIYSSSTLQQLETAHVVNQGSKKI